MKIDTLYQLINKSLNADKEVDSILSTLVEEEFKFPYYKLLYYLSKESDVTTCVELGVHRAVGSAMMAYGNPKCTVHGFDHEPHPQAFDVFRKLNNIQLYQISSCPPPDNFPNIDILYLDTTIGMKKEEYKLWNPLVKEGGVILMDDLNSCDGELISWFYGLPGVPIKDDNLHPIVGFGILLKV